MSEKSILITLTINDRRLFLYSLSFRVLFYIHKVRSGYYQLVIYKVHLSKMINKNKLGVVLKFLKNVFTINKGIDD